MSQNVVQFYTLFFLRLDMYVKQVECVSLTKFKLDLVELAITSGFLREKVSSSLILRNYRVPYFKKQSIC